MASGLMSLALGGAFFLLAMAATIDLVRDNLPTPLPKELSPRARRAMAWVWPLIWVVLGIPATIAGLSISPLVTASDWPWTIVAAVLFLTAGILQIVKSLRSHRTAQRLQT